MKVIPLDRWLDKTRTLLQMEREAEIGQAKIENDTLPPVSNPNVLLHLLMTSASTGLFGRRVLVLKHNQGREFGAHHFNVGDLVSMCIPTASLTPANADGFPKGIVTKVEDNSIAVAFEELEDTDAYHNESIRLDRLVNDATYRKLMEGLDVLAKYTDGPARHIVDVIFHGAAPSSSPLPSIDLSRRSTMNPSQVGAIQFALESKDIAMIHGPPGTGKTTTLVEFITLCVQQYQMKVLVCAPSNIAVDNILDKMASAQASKKSGKLRMTRLGHPARLLPHVLKHCLDSKIQSAEGTQIIADIRKELAGLKPSKATFHAVRQERKALRKEIRVREEKVVSEIIEHSDVVFATNAGAATKLLRNVVFDVVVIDEAAQALEASCWIPLLLGKRCVLAGDHHQLPPTIQSEQAARKGLGLTLFDRVTQMEHSKGVVRMLSTQYRMHHDISSWSSKAMYANQLASCDSVATRKLSDLAHVNIESDALDATLLLVDTAGCGLDEESEEGSGILKASKSNQGEALVAVQHVKALLATGLRPSEVAVITPYNGQVGVLKRLLHPDHPTVEIRSVDGFQGCEKEAVVMSLVRSNATKQVGFLADDRRMNVAITRAKRHVALICDTDTLSKHPFLKALIDHFEEHGECRSAHEYLDVVEGGETSSAVAAAIKAATAVGASSKPKTAETKKLPSTAPKLTQVKTKAPKSTGPTHSPRSPQEEPVRATQLVEEETPVPLHGTEEVPAAQGVVVPEEKAEVLVEERVHVTSAFALLSDGESSSAEENRSDDDRHDATHGGRENAPSMNATLKELHMARLARNPPPPSKKSAKKTKKGKSEQLLVKGHGECPPDEDEWGFLDRLVASANSCAFVSCTQKTHVTGSVCKFCKYKFCYSHGLPEVHGCGSAVRAFERANAAPARKPPKAANRQALQKALDTKLTKACQDRKPKPKKTTP
ncbi:hypothetical protein H310_01819 [Aphanomyces invadans]|uniref:DNA helicase n=1 Tax=Aphanomyces invadans TaxID=157072 RepID=A0A024UM39_9STRA|nr:hypothetical protein H310_01819 [Aphanomyces invadans]ETW07255.1 hypothetical protein H310_01819 [Aphanomyces invadans]|eukprot:XP_008863348.1 hypothetical protein H310_01819 [Aphanomyces invadans]